MVPGTSEHNTLSLHNTVYNAENDLFTVYTLSSGKNWRPDSSLGDNVEETDVQKFYQELDPKVYQFVQVHQAAEPYSGIPYRLLPGFG